jgi:hypothetical protein
VYHRSADAEAPVGSCRADMNSARHTAEGLARRIFPGWLELHAIFPSGHVQPPKLGVFVDFLVRQLAQKTAGA